MRIVRDDGEPLTNVELLRLLEDHGAGGQNSRRDALPLERKLYDYLAATTPAASTPTSALAAFAAGCAALGLTAPEALAALNLAPSREVEAYLVVPDLDARPVPGGAAALLALVKEHLVITPANGNGNGATTAQQEQQQPEEEQQQQPAAED